MTLGEKPVVTFIDIFVYFIKVCIVVVVVFLIYIIGRDYKAMKAEQAVAVYQEVYNMNHNENCKFVFDLLSIDSVRYYDWEETAASLDIPIDSLTIEIYMQHLLSVD